MKKNKNNPEGLVIPKGYRIAKEPKSIRMQLLLRPATKESIKLRAKAQGISMNELINRVLEMCETHTYGEWKRKGAWTVIQLENCLEQLEVTGKLHRVVDIFQCSQCGGLAFADNCLSYKYCPNCGAKMKEVEDNVQSRDETQR